MRRIPYTVPIYETSNLDEMGLVRNITDKGVGVQGFNVDVGDVREFVIVPSEYIDVDPIVFRAECRWVKKDENGDFISGFQIMEISANNLKELRKLLRFVSEEPFPPSINSSLTETAQANIE